MDVGRLGSQDSYGGFRRRLVEALQAKGIRDLAVLHAVSEVPRHLFVPEAARHRAYEDCALPLHSGQTISQPWVQARSLELLRLKGGERVLEVGAGSGYQTALLAKLAAAVFSIERLPALAQGAKRALSEAGIVTVNLMIGDGTLGWRAYAPFDAIVVAAASDTPPKPLLEQLASGGRMVMPISTGPSQVLTLFTKSEDGLKVASTAIAEVRFVPLLGRHGTPTSDDRAT